MSGEGRIKFSRVYEGLLREAFLFAGRGNRAYRTQVAMGLTVLWTGGFVVRVMSWRENQTPHRSEG